MDATVTIHACSSEHLNPRVGALERPLIRVRSAPVTTGTMTFLTELRRPADQHGAMVTAMHVVTNEAVFGNRLMFVSEGTRLFGMAGKTEFVDTVGLDHFFTKPAMRIMAIGTSHSAFLDRVMRLPVGHHSDLLMTAKTKFRLCRFQTLPRAGTMDGVTVVAGDLRRLVPTIVPESEVA